MNRFVRGNLTMWAAASLLSLVALTGTAQASFIDLNNGTVRDTYTNLQWERDTSDSTFDWAGAVAYGSALNLNGVGWRLASRNELIQLYADMWADNLCIGSDCTGNRTPFLGIRQYYWSSTDYVSGTSWGFDFTTGSALAFVSDNPGLYAFAVRDKPSNAVPEPDSYVMLLTGFGLLGLVGLLRNSAIRDREQVHI